MSRLRAETLERVESYADRVLKVTETVQRQRRSRRIVDQMAGAGTSVGANTFEADQALTARDFAKTLGVVVKELSETKFWLRPVVRRQWIGARRLTALLGETDELLAIFNSMILRTRAKAKRRPTR